MLDARLIREEFPQADDIVYLNHAGVAPLPASAARAVAAFAEECTRVGAARYAEWMARERRLREQLAAFINAPSPDDIALLKNTSEALSVVAEGLDWHWGDNVVGADEEFPSNRMPWEAQARSGVTWRGVSLRVPDPEAALMNACDERTRVLAVSSVQYGSGLRLDLERLGRFCRERGILFCVDAIQSLIVKALRNKADLSVYPKKLTPLTRFLPKSVFQPNRRFLQNMHEQGLCNITGMISYPGKIDLEAFSTKGFQALGIYGLPIPLEDKSIFVGMFSDQYGNQATLTVPSALSTIEQTRALGKTIEQRLMDL